MDADSFRFSLRAKGEQTAYNSPKLVVVSGRHSQMRLSAQSSSVETPVEELCGILVSDNVRKGQVHNYYRSLRHSRKNSSN